MEETICPACKHKTPTFGGSVAGAYFKDWCDHCFVRLRESKWFAEAIQVAADAAMSSESFLAECYDAGVERFAAQLRIVGSKLDGRIQIILGRNSINTFAELIKKSRGDLLELKGIGPAAVAKIEALLGRHSMELRA